MKHRLRRRPVVLAPLAAAAVVAACVGGVWWVVDDASTANAAMAAAQVADLNCDDFATQAEAQTYFDSRGYTAGNDPEGLDDYRGVGDGVACEGNPSGPPIATYTPAPAEPPSDAERAAVADDRVNAK